MLAANAMQHDMTRHRESHSVIESDCMMVPGCNMEPGHDAIATMVSYKMPDNARSISFAAMLWMRAHAANLGVAFEHQAFAAHRDQLTARSYPVIRAHLTRSAAKEAGERESCKSYHLRCICIGQANDLYRRIRRCDFLRQHHLKTLQRLFENELRNRWEMLSHNPQSLILREERMELLQCHCARFSDRCKRSNSGEISACSPNRHSQMRVLRLNSMPYRICEKILW